MTLRKRSKPYSNIENGLLKGTSSTNQATVPKGRLLIIEYVSGFIFRPPSSALNSEIGGHRSGPWPQRRRVSHIPGRQGELYTTERRIRLLGSAENDAASGGQFLFLQCCGPRGVWISGEVQGRRIALFPFARSMTTTRPWGRGMTWIVVT